MWRASADVDKQRLLEEVRDEAVGWACWSRCWRALRPLKSWSIGWTKSSSSAQPSRLVRVPLAFSSEKAMMGVIERIVAPVVRAHRRKLSAGGCAAEGRVALQRHHSTAGPERAIDDHPQVLQTQAGAEDLIKFGSANSANGGVPADGREAAQEHHRFGWHRLRQRRRYSIS